MEIPLLCLSALLLFLWIFGPDDGQGFLG